MGLDVWERPGTGIKTWESLVYRWDWMTSLREEGWGEERSKQRSFSALRDLEEQKDPEKDSVILHLPPLFISPAWFLEAFG